MDKPIRVLLIDDSIDLGFLVRVSLKPYEIYHVFSAKEAREAIQQNTYDLLLIDVTLPDGDGFEICSEFAKNLKLATVPKIMLTAKSESEDKVFGFHCGADDYITKPFAPSELRARTDARLRGRLATVASMFHWEDFEFDGHFQKCWISDENGKQDLQLTPTEYRLLLCLAKNQGLPTSREELVETVWKNHGTNIERRGIDAHIANLRKKMGIHGSRIVSVYGKGYALEGNSVSSLSLRKAG